MSRMLALLMAVPAAASAAPYPYTMSGDRFVQMMGALEASPDDAYAYMQREKAYGYLDGVRDGAEGKVWCDVDQYKTPDMAYEIADKLARLPVAERKRNASLLILRQLKTMYPCRKSGGRP